MSEGPPKQERAPQPTKQQVIERLRENPQDLGPYLAWLETRENQVERSDDPRQGLRLIFESAEVLRDAGILQGAREAFEQAAMQAHYEDPELYSLIQDELDKLQEPS